ncbi:hypothetical protein HJG60_008463 [Phyllostomus discolor]|uniref:Uncharacterized protein n=1 Tax=Phyllostomus discolor TaxID=89673 RepID=A0A833YX78_9CHIR|nr:hypothetical protein HJG60_008463 [Phyllostomus discolor]
MEPTPLLLASFTAGGIWTQTLPGGRRWEETPGGDAAYTSRTEARSPPCTYSPRTSQPCQSASTSRLPTDAGLGRKPETALGAFNNARRLTSSERNSRVISWDIFKERRYFCGFPREMTKQQHQTR